MMAIHFNRRNPNQGVTLIIKTFKRIKEVDQIYRFLMIGL